MQTIAAIYLWTVSIAIIAYMIFQAWRGTHRLLTLRNLFLIGFIIFQLNSGAISIFMDDFGGFRIQNPSQTGVIFVAMSTAWLLVFLFSYEKLRLARRMASWVPQTAPSMGSFGLLILAAAFLVLGTACIFAMPTELLAKLGQVVGFGFIAIACGLAGWVWAPRFLNPPVAVICVCLVIAAIAISLTSSFGRRPLVGVGSALVWGMYYSHWRYLPFRSQVLRLTVISAVPLLLLAAVTSIRTAGDKGKSVSLNERVAQIQQSADYSDGFLALLHGQGTGACAMWVIENYPSPEPYEHFMTIKFFFVRNWPREWWPNKPVHLAERIPPMARLWGTRWGNHTRPAGVVGNSAAEGGWYAVVLYGILFGMFIRFFDELLISHPNNPCIIISLGTSLGQILGLARGEPAIFANIYVTNVVAAWLLLTILAKLFSNGVQPLPSRVSLTPGMVGPQ